ncbi:Abscisic stress-ripening protein 1 [Dendrobium catenatum]|uniref:Abscisic stress-ripening protein 1 n=2 Tax=Dendrobium catenatum TaxID=906689 RepID=A0A2I0VZX8_9ASPA|nr:Abscisic stress-ripening protein 1 [Dendrobium catenatum]
MRRPDSHAKLHYSTTISNPDSSNQHRPSQSSLLSPYKYPTDTVRSPQAIINQLPLILSLSEPINTMSEEHHHHHHFGHHHKEEEEKRFDEASYPTGGGDGYGQKTDYSASGDGYGGTGGGYSDNQGYGGTGGYTETTDYNAGGGGYSDNTGYGGGYTAYKTEETTVADYEKETKEHKKKEHLGEAGALAAGAFALYEKHESKKHPEQGHRHKIEEEVAAAVGVASGGYAFHEHHEKKEAKEEEEEAEGKKKHHFF